MVEIQKKQFKIEKLGNYTVTSQKLMVKLASGVIR
jgi:hypothetical protein